MNEASRPAPPGTSNSGCCEQPVVAGAPQNEGPHKPSGKKAGKRMSGGARRARRQAGITRLRIARLEAHLDEGWDNLERLEEADDDADSNLQQKSDTLADIASTCAALEKELARLAALEACAPPRC
jgi:hypothetical protein